MENLKIIPNPSPGLSAPEMDNLMMGELIIKIMFRKETSRFMTPIDLCE